MAAVLRGELSKRSWRKEPVVIGAATDPYQPAEGRYRLTDVERACDVRNRDRDRGLRERECDPARLQRRAEQTGAAERRQQADARDGRWKHERELDERDAERATGKASAGEQIRGRRAEHQDERLRDQGRLEADNQRIGDNRVGELLDQSRRRDVHEDGEDRQRQERERYAGSEEVGNGKQSSAHGLPAHARAQDPGLVFGIARKPAASSFFWPPLLRISLMYCCAANLFELEETIAIA